MILLQGIRLILLFACLRSLNQRKICLGQAIEGTIAISIIFLLTVFWVREDKNHIFPQSEAHAYHGYNLLIF
jgi:hypothetical protein